MGTVTPEFVAAVSAHTGVPQMFLTGDTTAEVWDAAQRLADWKARTSPAAPPTAAVSASSPPPTRITAQQLVKGDQWTAAWRAGRLTPLGAQQPPPRRHQGNTRTNQ